MRVSSLRIISPMAVALACAALSAGCSSEETRPPEPPAACASYAFTDDGTVRVFAIQPRIEPDNYTTYEAYRGHLMRLVDERVRPCLATDRPNVLVFPEDLGLPAAFIGSRGESARKKNVAALAFLALNNSYSDPVDHYKKSWPDLGLAEGVLLGLTDTLWRAFHETSRDIATSTGAYVVASTNVSGQIEESTDAAEVAALADPDLAGVTSVHVARDRRLHNTAFVYSPDGAVESFARKPYLVPTEETDLMLSYGSLSEVRPLEIGGMRAGIVTSKDAWMPDMIDRLHALGADVLLQPEAFSGWGIEEYPGDWLPGVLQQSGWAATQKHGGLRAAVIPHLTGNLFELVFDGQSAIIADTVPGEVGEGYVGQPPSGGFLQVAPWMVEDPGVSDPGLSLEERRAVLRAAGEAALPGGEDENGYVEGVVAADLAPAADFPVVEDGAPGALGPSRAVAPSDGEQVFPAIAAAGDRVIVAWQEVKAGVPKVMLARSEDGGASFGAGVAVAAGGEQRAPALWASGDSVVVAWQESDAAGRRIALVRSEDGGATFGDVELPGGAAAGADSWGPSLAADGGTLFVAFTAMVDANERVLVGRSTTAGTWAIAPADPEPLAFAAGNPRNNQWAPSISARMGGVGVAWVGFRSFHWDVFTSVSGDGGVTFQGPDRTDDAGDLPERIHSDPSLIIDQDLAFVAAWTDVRDRKTPARGMVTLLAGLGGASVELGSLPDDASSYRPRLAETASGTLVAVWQDNRTGGSDIYLSTAVYGPAKAFSGEARVDDGGEGPSYQFAPAVAALPGDEVVVAWEDTRSGKRQIRIALGEPGSR